MEECFQSIIFLFRGIRKREVREMSKREMDEFAAGRDLSCIDPFVEKLSKHLKDDILRFKIVLFIGLVASYKIEAAEAAGTSVSWSEVIGESLFQWVKDN